MSENEMTADVKYGANEKSVMQKRKERLIMIAVLYCEGALMYGSLAFATRETTGIGGGIWLLYGIFGGWILAGLLTGIFMLIDFADKRSLATKIGMCILFPLTLAITVYAGILAGIPYIIYQIVQCSKNRTL